MKRCISDYIEKLDNEDLYLFLGNNVSYETAYDKSIVIFSHEFTRTGAPTVLLDLVEVLVRNEYCVFVVSEIGGELRNDFIECGANLIIYPEYMNNSSWMEKVSKLFDVFLVNTLLCTFTVSALADKVTSVYWWIHESEIWFEKLTNICLGVAHASATRFLAASTKVQGLITKYFGVESEVLNFCVKETEKSIEAKDCAESELVDKSKITFLQVGSVDYNKGQEILADAIMSLSPEEMERSEFIFCGKTDRADEVILNKIENTVNKCSNVKLLPAIPREELFSLYDDVDVIIVPSYSETTSAIAVEAFMKKKICICSDGCGICEYITDGQDALIFKSGNMQALKDKISYVIEHFSDLSYVAGNGRKIYEKYYKEDIFEKKVLSLLKVNKSINSNMNECSGCGACAKVCPVSAITMVENDRGFLYPHIDEEKCIDCGKCERVCAVNYDKEVISGQEIYAVKLKDTEKRLQSQSGGAFTAIAENVLEMNGVVYGVGYNEALEVVYMGIDCKEDLYKLKGSKYVQARVGDVFLRVKEALDNGKKVLFSGTACHVNGLIHYLNKQSGKWDKNNLITCDLICHGVPSPKLYRDYLKYVEEKKGRVTSFNFRDKIAGGWRSIYESCINDKGENYVSSDYTGIFYSNNCLRESCYICRYSGFERITDITVGDFWGVENVYPEMDDAKGVSLMLLNTEKGRQIFRQISDKIEVKGVSPEQCKQHNLIRPTDKPLTVDEFWKDYNSKDLRYVLRKYSNEFLATNGNIKVLSDWATMLKEGKMLASYFIKNKKTRVALCGDIKNNNLLMGELRKNYIFISAVIDIYNTYNCNNVSGVDVVTINKFIKGISENTDVVLITDETHCVDIMTALYRAGISTDKILPISFITVLEV